MLKEGSTPMTAYEAGAKPVPLEGEMGRDEGKDIQRDAVYVKEGVPPLPDIRQRGRDVLVELRNIVESKAAEEVSVSFLKISRASPVIFRDLRRRICRMLQLLAQGEDELRKRKALSRVSMRVHRGAEEDWRKARVLSAIALGEVFETRSADPLVSSAIDRFSKKRNGFFSIPLRRINRDLHHRAVDHPSLIPSGVAARAPGYGSWLIGAARTQR